MGYRDNMSPSALATWDRLVAEYGNLNINSAYRSPEHNARVGGAKHSQHVHGNAFDVDVSGMDREQRLALISAARNAGFRGIGVYDNALHFDVGAERAWGADYTRSSLPDWAAGAVTGGYSGNALMGQEGGGTSSTPTQNALERPEYRANALDPRAFMVARKSAPKLRFT